jgi:Ca2+/Na+ antiporter
MKFFIEIIQILLGSCLIFIAFLIECMCEITYVRNPSDLNTPRMVAIILFFVGVVIFSYKVNHNEIHK